MPNTDIFQDPTTAQAYTPIPILSNSSILRASGYYANLALAFQNIAIPTSLSSANWSDEAQGLPQQTFLGASIRSFNMQGGFGDSSSTLSVDLVVDEFNVSDRTPIGLGDDIYHNGRADKFIPPIPGSPVFFKFGPNFATIEEAYRKTFDEIYFTNTIPRIPNINSGSTTIERIKQGNFPHREGTYVELSTLSLKNYPSRTTYGSRGKDHITFGGILQTFTQNRSSAGNPLYSVGVVDPREILSNVNIILNNYSGPTYGQSNVMNVFGFLEFNSNYTGRIKNQLYKTLNYNTGEITFGGDDCWYSRTPPDFRALRQAIKDIENNIAAAKRNMGTPPNYQLLTPLYNALTNAKRNLASAINNAGPKFPITGTGFSRRCAQGIPFYRIKDAINALTEYSMNLPEEYKQQGFGGKINFRGFNYIVDFGGLPELPEFYYLDFDQINLLELALEICDITSRDLFVTLLPVINHPACSFTYNYNLSSSPQNLIAGIIRLDTIDRSQQPFYGAVKTYIDNLTSRGIDVENQDVGYELSNVVTDKFIVGAQEVENYFFSSNVDRGMQNVRGGQPDNSDGYQWTLNASLEQQILPYYGKLGNNAVTIPKGFGAYQQILLDSSSLDAAGVGMYYVATEMELRCALISFDRWKEFLLTYNDVYMESIESDDPMDANIAQMTPSPSESDPPVSNISSSYAVTVPRSVFDTYGLAVGEAQFGRNGLPISSCNPPYGYPLYYKRATQIGIPEGGLTNLFNRWVSLNTNLAELANAGPKDIKGVLNSQYQKLKKSQPLTEFEKRYLAILESLLKNPTPQAIQNSIGLLENTVRGGGKKAFAILPSLAKKNTKNALRVYEFVKSVAEECLGKKFLVKIPINVNLSYDKELRNTNGIFTQGPFGFRPRSTRDILGYEFSDQFKSAIGVSPNENMIKDFLQQNINMIPNVVGALRVNFNPISEKYESNYTPMNLGGYFPFDLYQNTMGASAISNIAQANFNSLPLGIKQGLIPQDLTNFINEDGRVSAYAVFHHSEDLSLDGFSASDFTQQYIVGNFMIPDLTESLDNTAPDEFTSFPNLQAQGQSNIPKPPQIAFVKCSVDEQLYFPPKTELVSVGVCGQRVRDIGTKSVPAKIFVPCSGVEGGQFVPGSGVTVDSFSFYLANFVPQPGKGSSVNILDFQRRIAYNLPGSRGPNNVSFIDTEFSSLDTNNAYALITLPNRVIPNKDSRFRDGQFQSVNAERFKHLMTMDTVRGLPGFNLPANPMAKAPIGNLKPGHRNVPINTTIKAWFAMKKVHAGLSFGFPQQINMTMPSPVYPDLVSLPLISNDRCYGPWISSQLDGQAYILKNIGGRVEFIKDENLSPWNYSGYFLMNEAGRKQAEFSNSALLFSERGSFTIPDIPQSNTLCRALLDGGPLVTSINVDISTQGARTTYQMDLYTPSFGKLQKQKQDEISKISRERKKITSERNSLIRKGLGKNQVSRNIQSEYDKLNLGAMPGLNEMGLGMANAMTTLVTSVDAENRSKWSSIAGNHSTIEHSAAGSLQNSTQLGKTSQFFTDQLSMAGNYGNSCERQLFGNGSENPLFEGVSNGYHANMAYRPNANNAMPSLYFMDKTELEDDWSNDVTKYGDTV